MSIVKGINNVSLHIVKWEEAKRFYSETLGLGAPAFCVDEFGWCEYGAEGATHLALNRWNDPTPPSREGGGTIVLEVADCPAAVAELRAKGVRCEDPIGIPGMVTYATFYDPEGNRLQLAGMPPAQ